jgi:predicted transcriptional regulator
MMALKRRYATLTQHEKDVLDYIRKNGPQYLSDLKYALDIHWSTIYRSATNLVIYGFLTRTPDKRFHNNIAGEHNGPVD